VVGEGGEGLLRGVGGAQDHGAGVGFAVRGGGGQDGGAPGEGRSWGAGQVVSDGLAEGVRESRWMCTGPQTELLLPVSQSISSELIGQIVSGLTIY